MPAGYIGAIPNSRGRQIGRLKLDFSRSWRWPVGMLSTYRRLRDSIDRRALRLVSERGNNLTVLRIIFREVRDCPIRLRLLLRESNA